MKEALVGVLATENEDVRSLRELITYGLKGIAAYAEHAYTLEYKEAGIFAFIEKALAATLDDTLAAGDLVALTLEAGKYGVEVMVLLPGFLSPNVVNVLVENFGIAGISTVEEDLKMFMA